MILVGRPSLAASISESLPWFSLALAEEFSLTRAAGRDTCPTSSGEYADSIYEESE